MTYRRRISAMKLRTFVLLALLISVASCGPAYKPPTLSPAASVAWDGTKVIRALDVIRDLTIDGEKQTPKVFSTEMTRKVVVWHTAAITTVHAAPAGWSQTVQTGLEELQKLLTPTEQQQIGPYLALARTVLKEVAR